MVKLASVLQKEKAKDLSERFADIMYSPKWYLDKRNPTHRLNKPHGHTLASIRNFKGL